MQNFAAIDFEMANFSPSSICSVGVVVVRQGVIVDRFYSLIKPKPNYYNFYCARVNGLSQEDTKNSQSFPEVWKQVEPLIEGVPFVAHNCNCDRISLKAAFRAYKMKYPNYVFHCTLKAAQKKLPNLEGYKLHTVAQACGYEMATEHHALIDAEACAAIALKLL